jgi:RND family efflux transporter MFP subunit
VADQLSSDLASLRIRRDAPPPGASLGRKAIVTVLGLGALATAVVIAYQKVAPRIYKQPVSITEVALVSPAQSSVIVTATGYVVPQSWSKVGAKLPGRLSRVMVKEGDVVKAGDVIALLDGADQQSNIVAAESRARVARAGIETARANLAEVNVRVERTRALVAQQAMPATELQDLEARQKVLAETVRAADAQAAAAGAEVGTWRVGMKDRVIVAPINGTVIAKPAMAGETVGPQLTGVANIAEIADFSSIVVEADVPEARLGLITVGGPAEIVLDAYPQRRYRGTTVDIGKRVNRAKASVVVKVKFTDTLEGVLPDMSARVSFLREELKQEALKEKAKKVVAAGAVVERNGSKVVFVVEDGKLKMSKVALGPAVGGSVELLEGPAVGARVVRNPGTEAFEGQRIKEGE